ncbi:MAG TPA: polymer-forming cytoskeletal protein [Rhizomicrobium sp.]|nr:polymer-forming cytoskeletal protein [Rhizomicrobium sp.]
MSMKQNGGADFQAGSMTKPGGGAVAPKTDHTIGEAMERLQSIYSSESAEVQTDVPPASDAPARKPMASAKATDGALVACAGVKLKGEIMSCGTLTVEGEVDAKVRARQIIVANGGVVTGKAEVVQAEIAGRFEGTLHVSGKLTIRRTGVFNGQVTYGQLEIEPGGELRGRVDVEGSAAGAGQQEKSWSWRA